MRSLLFCFVLSICSLRPESLAIGEQLSSRGVTGSFRLEKRTFCVGEPIPIEFRVVNGGENPYSFDVGSDYRGVTRHTRFLFAVKNDVGRDFTPRLREHDGGLGTTITLKSGEQYASWQLLNGWTQLLPPGHYHVHCRTRLTDDFPLLRGDSSQPRSNPTEIIQELEFEITSYQKAQILAALSQLKTRYEAFDWALKDLAAKFQTGINPNSDDAQSQNDVMAALPQEWNDRYFAEYDLTSNRNWVSAESPEDLWLTISVINTSDKVLPLYFANSSLVVNGVRSEKWHSLIERAMKANNIGSVVQAGERIEVRVMGNELLFGEKSCSILWRIDGFSKKLQITIRGG